MPGFKYSFVTQSGGWDQDRIEVLRAGHQTVIVVADGAGGVAGGTRAAETVCVRMRSHIGQQDVDWREVLQEIDTCLVEDGFGGQSTCVVAEVREGIIRGASVGDSGAWLVTKEGLSDLTEGQSRKPLLGSGDANPRAFGPVALRGRLLVATDGLFKYVPWDDIARISLPGTLGEAVAALVAAARLPNGALQDDITLVLGGRE